MSAAARIYTFLLIPPDGQGAACRALMGDPPTADELRHVVEAHLLAPTLRLEVCWHGSRADMFVDDIGLAKGLERNPIATELYRRDTLNRMPGIDPESLPAVHGAAVLFEGCVWPREAE